MATHTSNYNLSKPENTDTQASLVSAYRDNMDIIDKQMGNKNIAEEYDNTQTYAVDDYVIYDGDLYKCVTAVISAEDFDSTKWTQTVASDEFGSGGGGSSTLAGLSDVNLTTPSNGQVLKYNSTSQKWENANESGGGGGGHVIIDENDTEVAQEPNMQFTGKVEVTDDPANEKTVVEVLPEVVEVTLAEYIALGNVVNTDGKLYCITDLNNSDVQGYPPLIYSTDEREVGVWTDGKPLYQKTIDCGVAPAQSQIKSVAHNISNIEFIVDFKGFGRRGSDGATLFIPNISRENVTSQTSISVNTTNVNINNGSSSDLNANYNVYVTLQYTKTTDVAGSGIWNGQGGYAHHYSTSEKVIGTWIDGKPLYEITVEFSSELTVNSGTFTNTTITTTNKKAIINVVGSNGSGTCWNMISANCDNGSYVQVYHTRGSAITLKYLTIQYTKTTD